MGHHPGKNTSPQITTVCQPSSSPWVGKHHKTNTFSPRSCFPSRFLFSSAWQDVRTSKRTHVGSAVSALGCTLSRKALFVREGILVLLLLPQTGQQVTAAPEQHPQTFINNSHLPLGALLTSAINYGRSNSQLMPGRYL